MSQDELLEGHLLDQIKNTEKGSTFFWHRIRTWIVLKMIDRYGPKKENKLILDIGAGAGVFGYHLKKSRPGDRYAFIEPLESLAQALVLSHGSQSNWTHQTQGKEDVAVCLDVLEHIHDDSAFLKNYEKSLSNATTLILTVPALPCLSSNWDKALGHERRYTRSRLRSVLEGAGFEIIEIHYIFQSMIFPALLRKFQSTQNIESAEFPSLPDAINSLMTFLLKIENRLLGWLPFGTSLVAVVRKKNATRQN